LSRGLEERKIDGVRIPLEKDVQARDVTTLFEDVVLIHNALPELSFSEIDTSTNFLNHKFSAPILIDAMTGGVREAEVINGNLAAAAEELGLGMCVGSQRAGLESEKLASTYSIARRNAPNAFIAGNIGAAQLAKGFTVDDAKRLVEMIRADALAVHLNPLQELIQPEGEPEFKGVLSKIRELVLGVGVPVIVKETGAGISKEVAVKLEVSGVSAVNISGAGGTSWAAVEHYRAEKRGDLAKAGLGRLLWDWGIPTAASLIEVRRAVKIPVVASGGIRSGLDVAKSIVLGANLVGVAYPLLAEAVKSKEAVVGLIRRMMLELKSTMFLVGAASIGELSKARYIVKGELAEWVRR